MARDGSGGYSIPYPDFVAGAVIASAEVDANNADIVTAMAASLAKDGQTVPTANLPMGGFKHTGVSATSGNSSRSEYASGGTVQDSGPLWGGTAAGSADARTASLSPAITAYATGQIFRFINGAAANATATPTVNFNSVGAKTVVSAAGGAILAGDMAADTLITVQYDGTNLRLLNPAVRAASETVAGVAEVATAAETAAGTDDARMVTPLKLRDWGGDLTAVTPTLLDSTLVSDQSDSDRAKRVLLSALRDLMLPRGYIDGYQMSNAADADHDITFAAGIAKDSADAFAMAGTALTKQIDAAWAAGTAAGGLFTGAVANTTWYTCFAIRKDSDGTIDYGFDTSVTAANKPAGYSNYRLLGAVLTDGSANILAFTQHGDEFLFTTKPTVLSWTNSATASLQVVHTPLGRKTWCIFNVSNDANVLLYVSSPDETGSAPSGTASPLATTQATGVAGGRGQGPHRIRTDTSSQVRLDAGGASGTSYISTIGWIDPRGRDA